MLCKMQHTAPLIFTWESLTLSYVSAYPGSRPDRVLMSLVAMSAAGTTPDEFRPYCPKDVMNMKVRFVRFADWTQPTMARCRAIIKKAARK